VIQIITKKGVAGARPVFTFQVEQGALYFRDAAGRLPTNYLPDPANPTNIVTWNAVEAEKSLPLFRTGSMTGLQGSVSGGFDQARYYVSSAFNDSEGVEPNNGLKQFTLHANVDVTASPKLGISSSLNFVDLRARLGTDAGASVMYGANYGHRLFPGLAASRGFAPGIAPEAIWELWDNSQKVRRFTTSNTVTHRPTSWLTQRLNVGLDFTSDDGQNLERFASPSLQAVAPLISGVGATGRITQFLRNSTIFSIDYSGSARADISPSLSAATSVGLQTFRTESASSQLGGIGFAGAGVETINATATPQPIGSNATLNTTVGAYLQEKFSWRDRLFLTGAVRVDNNSAFGEDFKWVTYPKVDFAWVVSEEPFWGFGNVINTLRLRTAYGESGRAPNTFSALRTFGTVQGPGGTNAVTPGSLGNPNLRPERGKELEVGFEAEVLRRLSLDFTYYKKKTVDLIVNQPVAPSSGFPGSVPTNLGRVDNSGIELRAVLQALEKENLRWEISGSIATTNDEIKDLGALPSTISAAGTSNQLGYPVQGVWSRKIFSATRNPTTHAITNVLCDSAGVGVPCTRGQFHFIGPTLPTTTGAVTSTLTLLKRLRLFAMFDFQRGNFVFNGNEAVRCSGLLGRQLCHANYFPAEYSTNYLASTTVSSITQHYIAEYVDDVSYVKLRELSLSYQLPPRFLRGVRDASITVAARELATWTKYKGLDPDYSNLTDQAVLPQLSRLTAILNVRF
jgi:outer membrane receptor protein involved in Fe transport